jgi:hypothetical protein
MILLISEIEGATIFFNFSLEMAEESYMHCKYAIVE